MKDKNELTNDGFELLIPHYQKQNKKKNYLLVGGFELLYLRIAKDNQYYCKYNTVPFLL